MRMQGEEEEEEESGGPGGKKRGDRKKEKKERKKRRSGRRERRRRDLLPPGFLLTRAPPSRTRAYRKRILLHLVGSALFLFRRPLFSLFAFYFFYSAPPLARMLVFTC